MKSPVNIIRNIIISINDLIDGLNANTVRNIRQGFFFLFFILAIVAMIIGFNMGKESARIKSPPLAKNVNDTFEIDISREKSDGDFGSLLESQVLTESRYTRPMEKPYKISQDLTPEHEVGIIDDTKQRQKKPIPELRNQKDILEGKYRPEKKEKGSVDVLIEEKNKKEPAPVNRNYTEKKEDKAEKGITVIKDRETTKERRSEPTPILKDRGIIEK